MSESPTFRLDQAARIAPQNSGEQFNVPTTFTQPEPETILSEEKVAAATHDAYNAAAADERLIFTDQRRGNFEVRSTQPEQPTVTTEANMLDDSYAEMVRARQRAAELQAEHEALEAQNVRAIAATGQIIEASRNYAEVYGLAA